MNPLEEREVEKKSHKQLSEEQALEEKKKQTERLSQLPWPWAALPPGPVRQHSAAIGLGTGTRSPSLAGHQPQLLEEFSSSCVFLSTLKGNLSHRSQLDPTLFFSTSVLAQPLNNETCSSLSSALLMKSSKKTQNSQMQTPSLRGSVLGGQRQGGMDPAAKQQKGQKKNSTAEQPWRCSANPGDCHSRGLQSPQFTSPLLLWAMDQHKQKPQAKLSGHETLFRP